MKFTFLRKLFGGDVKKNQSGVKTSFQRNTNQPRKAITEPPPLSKIKKLKLVGYKNKEPREHALIETHLGLRYYRNNLAKVTRKMFVPHRGNIRKKTEGHWHIEISYAE